MISKSQFASYTGAANADKYYDLLISELTKVGLNSKLRMCAFLAEAFVESSCFHATKENLNYNAQGLCNTWKEKFPTPESALPYAHQPEKIANYVYGGRNGNNLAGDGWKYIGRGIFQETGRDGYILIGKILVLDLLNHPELLEQPDNAIKAAVAFWNINGLTKYADTGEFEKISKAINRGNPNSKYPANGNAERNSFYKQLLAQWGQA